MQRLASEITVSSGVNTGPPMTIPGIGPSTGPYPPSSTWPSNEPPYTGPTSIAGLTGPESSFNDVAAAFLSNKGAAAGVFAGLGVLLLSLCAVIYLGWRHRRRKNAKHSRKHSIDSTVVDFKTHIDPPYPYLGSEPPKISSKRSSNSSHPISLASIAEWWGRRRGGRRSSQFSDVFDRSLSPSLAGADVKNLGEDTQWTLGKVLEDQRQQVITPLAPVSRAPKRSQLVQTSTTPGVRQGGRRFTLEDALFPSPSSPPAPYETTGGRHPYAQG